MSDRIEIGIGEKSPEDQEWIESLLRRAWASTEIVTRGKVHNAASLPAFLASLDGERLGLVTYRIARNECEIVTLNSLSPGLGIGSLLLEAVEAQAMSQACRRLWLITTNDNTYALHFYQKRGFRIAAIHFGAVEVSRKLKPEIPRNGCDNIPITDEIELERILRDIG